MLESRGYHVTSVLGNDEALRLDAVVIAAADSIVIGFSAPYPVRGDDSLVQGTLSQYPGFALSGLD
jgi:hypothetical protein